MLVQIFIKYLQTEKRFSPHTVKAYNTDLKQFENYIESTYNVNIHQVDNTIIRSWINHLRLQKLDNRSINRKISSLKSCFHFLHANSHIMENPTERIKLLKTKKQISVFVPQSDMERTQPIRDKENFKELRDSVIFEILYQTGMRASELISLNIQDIDFYNATIKVKGKGNKERILPFTNILAEQLKDYMKLRNELFPDTNHLIVSARGKKAYESMLYRIIRKRLTEITTVSKKSPHILRHSFATHMLNNGASLIAIKELLGHASLAATEVYTHNSIEQLKLIHKKAHPKGGAK